MYHIIVVGVVLEDTCTTTKKLSSSKTPSSPESLTSVKFVLGMNADTGMNDADDDTKISSKPWCFEPCLRTRAGVLFLGRRCRRTPHNTALLLLLLLLLLRRLPNSLPRSIEKKRRSSRSCKDGFDAHVGRRRRPSIGDGAAGDVRANVSGMKNEEEEEEEEEDDDARQRDDKDSISLLLTQIFRREVERVVHAQTRVGWHAAQFENDERGDEDNDDDKNGR